MSNNFPNAQQLTQPRSTTNRLFNGKSANNSTWAPSTGNFAMSSASFPNQRPSNSLASSFANSITGSQSAAPLDLSEFPSLSNNQPQQASCSAWAISGVRNLGQSISQRPQAPSSHNQQELHHQQQEELFDSSSQLPNAQASFRFGNHSTPAQTSHSSQNTANDEFPPLRRNINGEIGQDRGQQLSSSSGFGGQTTGSSFGGVISGSRTVRSNGLLNALSGNTRQTSTQGSRSPIGRQQSSGISNENDSSSFPTLSNHLSNASTAREPIGTQPLGPPVAEALEVDDSVQLHSSQRPDASTEFGLGSSLDDTTPEIEDPLSPYADQAALMTGFDVNSLGFDLSSSEKYSEQIWSPFDDTISRPAVPKFTLPDGYKVDNVQPVENKLSNFTDETLMFMFYSNPQDIQQIIAAHELTNRNWRYHKKAQAWLTKDEMMTPQTISNHTEQGSYVFFDPQTWRRQRRLFVLNYDDLETIPQFSNQVT